MKKGILAITAFVLLFACNPKNQAFVTAPIDPPVEEEGTVPQGAVDLGIVMTRDDGTTYKLYWATSNLCEDGLCPNPEDYGDYYAWGEIAPYYIGQDPIAWKGGKSGYNWASYLWCKGSETTLTKYCPENKEVYWGGEGTPDNKTEFKDYNYADDAARKKLNGKWRVPTDAEWTALRTNCTWAWTVQNGVNGRLVTAQNGNSIFLPAAGIRFGTDLCEAGTYGEYMSSTISSDAPSGVLYVNFNAKAVGSNLAYRFDGFSIRPVSE